MLVSVTVFLLAGAALTAYGIDRAVQGTGAGHVLSEAGSISRRPLPR